MRLTAKRHVREFLLEKMGGSLTSSTIVLDMGSSDPLGTVGLGKKLSEMGVVLLDAPVSGGVPRAKDGSLAIMVGGKRSDVEAVYPLLQSMGSTISHVGHLGSGHALKALNNYVSAAGLVAACEALRVAEAFGIDGQVAIDVFNSSTGRNNTTEKSSRNTC